MLDYAKQYINLVLNYREVWWKLFNAPVAKRWGNILTLAELLFCLLVGNGTLERVFSQLKLIKKQVTALALKKTPSINR